MTIKKALQILSWDCGIRSTSWALLSVTDGIIDLQGVGTIDFLEGNKLEDTSIDLWPAYIKSGLERCAPIVDKDVIVAIEIQHQRHRGRISSANAATQYSLGLWYASNPIRFVNATHKNEVGLLSMEAVSRMTGTPIDDCRKKHSRMNFELYWLAKHGTLPKKRGDGIKMRDVSDAFMQGIYMAKILTTP
jgi:hypothetical protein